MTREADIIKATTAPLTGRGIAGELRNMGLCRGDLVLLHVAMGQLGWIAGGVQTILEAVTEVLGQPGTLVMPGFSGHLTDPAEWSDPPVPPGWIAPIRDAMPLFDPDRSPTRGIGRAPEAFRAWPETRRSLHPNMSFLANGPLADDILRDHPLDFALGPASPLGRLETLGAKVLLLGAGYASCTAFHLAEHDLPGIGPVIERYPSNRTQGVTQWLDTRQSQSFEEDFETIGAEVEEAGVPVARGFHGAARLFDMRPAVAVARNWLISAAQDGRLGQIPADSR